jgi:hypothetical protein
MIRFFMYFVPLNLKIAAIEQNIKWTVGRVAEEEFWVTHYGATDVDPRHLVYWVCVKSDKEKQRLASNQVLNQKLRA